MASNSTRNHAISVSSWISCFMACTPVARNPSCKVPELQVFEVEAPGGALDGGSMENGKEETRMVGSVFC